MHIYNVSGRSSVIQTGEVQLFRAISQRICDCHKYAADSRLEDLAIVQKKKNPFRSKIHRNVYIDLSLWSVEH